MATPLSTQPELQWKDINVGETLGLDLGADTEKALEESLSKAINVVARENYLETDFGLVTFQAAVATTPRLVISILLTGGTMESFLICNGAVYRRLAGAWSSIGALNGSDDNPVHAVAVPFSDEVIFTNGVDNVKRINCSTFVVSDVPDLPANTKCVSLTVWDNSVFLFRTIENGTPFPRRYRYSASGSTIDWTTANDAGYADLHDSSDILFCGHAIGPYLAIYRSNSITRLAPTGDRTRRFDNPTVVRGTGVFSTHGVAEVDDNTHLVVSESNINKYTGGFSADPIGHQIDRSFLGPFGRLEKTYKTRLFCFFDRDDRKMNIFYTDSLATTGYPNKCFILSTDKDKWTERDFGIPISGYGEVSPSSISFAWQDLVGSWAAQTWKWGGSSVASINNTLLLCSVTAKTTVRYYSGASLDVAATIPITIETNDYGIPHMKSLIDNIVVIAAGGTLDVYASTNKGASWKLLGSKALDTTVVHKRYWGHRVCDIVRFRFVTTGYFKLVGFAFKMKVVSEF